MGTSSKRNDCVDWGFYEKMDCGKLENEWIEKIAA